MYLFYFRAKRKKNIQKASIYSLNQLINFSFIYSSTHSFSSFFFCLLVICPFVRPWFPSSFFAFFVFFLFICLFFSSVFFPCFFFVFLLCVCSFIRFSSIISFVQSFLCSCFRITSCFLLLFVCFRACLLVYSFFLFVYSFACSFVRSLVPYSV